MSSTSADDLARFYRERLLPAAEALRARGVVLLPGGSPYEDGQGGSPTVSVSAEVVGPSISKSSKTSEVSSGSFYEGPPSAPELMEIPEDGFGAALEALWRAQGLDELIPLAAELERLAQALKVETAESEEVSPFMYVIF